MLVYNWSVLHQWVEWKALYYTTLYKQRVTGKSRAQNKECIRPLLTTPVGVCRYMSLPMYLSLNKWWLHPFAGQRTTELYVTFNDTLWHSQIIEPSCHPFPIRESLLGQTAGHDRRHMSMAWLKRDLNCWPFSLRAKVLSRWLQSSLSDASKANLVWDQSSEGKAWNCQREEAEEKHCIHTHPHASAVQMNMLCKSRFQLLLHKELALALWDMESTFDGPHSCQSDPFCLWLFNDWIVNKCSGWLFVFTLKLRCGCYEVKPRLPDSWSLTSDLNNSELNPWHFLCQTIDSKKIF